MRHPTEGVLRRLLDEPAGVADADRDHVARCDKCLRELAAIREDADLVHAVLAAGPGTDLDVDVDAAWQRLSAAPSGTGGARPMAAPRSGRVRAALRRPAVAGVAVAVVLTGAGTAAANGWLTIFRTEEIVPLSVSTDDLNSVPDLSAYGELDVTGDPDVHTVPDAATAAAESGLDVPEVASLPRGVSGEPTYQVGGEVSATFTFSPDRAARAAADAGESLPPPPPGLEGSQLRLVAGPGVAAIWSQSSGVPALVVGRAGAPTAQSSSGVPAEALRDYLLSLPGLPDDVAAALRTFDADGSTLPLPVPVDHVITSPAAVDGERATVLTTRDGTAAAVVWVDDDVVTIVAGTLDADEVLSVARELR